MLTPVPSIDANVLQAELLKSLPEQFSARALLERRRRNFAEANLILDGLRLAKLRRVERRLHGGVFQEIGGRASVLLRAADAEGRRSRNCISDNEPPHSYNPFCVPAILHVGF